MVVRRPWWLGARGSAGPDEGRFPAVVLTAEEVVG
jgi:hypothetical protein